jgi:hypothetical protein
MKTIFVDPGLDTAGIAIFELNRTPLYIGFETAAALSQLHSTGEFITEPHEPMVERLAYLTAEMQALVVEHCPVAVYMEMPAFSGSYTGGSRRDDDVAVLYQAIGALQAGVGIGFSKLEMQPVFFTVRAPNTGRTKRKEERFEVLEQAAKKLGTELPRGPKGGKKEDVWDAMFLGVKILTTRIYADLKKAEQRAAAKAAAA